MKIFIKESPADGGERLRVVQDGEMDHYLHPHGANDTAYLILREVLEGVYADAQAAALAPLVQRRLSHVANAGCGVWAISEQGVLALVLDVLTEARKLTGTEEELKRELAKLAGGA